MITGFNHNFTYQELKLHIQTEDCGIKKPRIETHLFRDGTIVATRKTSYDDILKVDDLDKVVEELMKDQHREMLRCLKNGDYDKTLGVTRAKPDEADESLAGLPEELELDQLALDALAPDASTAVSGRGSAEKAEPEDIIEELELVEADLIETEEQAENVEGKTEKAPLTLEEVVMKYFLGESGKGLKN
ncbi:MAG: hypothetical protein JXK94_08005 [Deltaproteobacteria bacterium]|nr:hypothetical protein [Deltaproteobacteria bacterium]